MDPQRVDNFLIVPLKVLKNMVLIIKKTCCTWITQVYINKDVLIII